MLWGYTQGIIVYGRKDKFEIILSIKFIISQAGLELVILLLLSSKYWHYSYGPLGLVLQTSALATHLIIYFWS